MADEVLALEAAGLTLRTRRGHVYGPVDLALRAGETAMLVGAAGSGRTALLLTLGGRMRPSAGTLRVAGIDAVARPGAARRHAAFGVMPSVNDLPDALTVRDAARRELLLHGSAAGPERVSRLLQRLGMDIDPATRIAELTAGEHALVGLAFALVADPAVVLVDGVDVELTPSERDALLAAMASVAAAGTCVVASCTDPDAARAADVVVPMGIGSESEVAGHAFAQSR